MLMMLTHYASSVEMFVTAVLRLLQIEGVPRRGFSCFMTDFNVS